jgi:hypothetical protein
MTGLAGAVLEPDQVLGTGAYVAATPKMELGAVAPANLEPPMASYALPGPAIGVGLAASLPALRVPVVLPAQYVSTDYVRRFMTDPARARLQVVERIADALERETAQLSVVRRAVRHPAFRLLSSAGPFATSVALRRLRGEQRPLWLFFLQRATEERPAEGSETVDEAATLWRAWGKSRGLI